MLRTCSICGRIHDFDKVCYSSKYKKSTKQNKFRSSYIWQEKRDEIRERDMNLCQVCIRDKYNTDYMYNYESLEVHHIIPIEEDYSRRLDSYNLITLCNMHHRMAEEGIITREELQKIVAEYYDPPRGKEKKNK